MIASVKSLIVLNKNESITVDLWLICKNYNNLLVFQVPIHLLIFSEELDEKWQLVYCFYLLLIQMNPNRYAAQIIALVNRMHLGYLLKQTNCPIKMHIFGLPNNCWTYTLYVPYIFSLMTQELNALRRIIYHYNVPFLWQKRIGRNMPPNSINRTYVQITNIKGNEI